MPVARRLAENENLFREVNERIDELSTPYDDPVAFVCECSDRGCVQPIPVPLADYAAVREHPLWFLMAPGHERRDVERVLSDQDAYLVVESLGGAAPAASADDRRDA